MALNQSRLKYEIRTLIATWANSMPITRAAMASATQRSCIFTAGSGHSRTVVTSRVV